MIKDILRKMPVLTILHLRQYHYSRTCHSESEKEMAWSLQRWTSGLFAFLDRRGYCPHLHSIVIGMWRQPVPGRLRNSISRHFFVKGSQRIRLGEESVIAVPVSQVQSEFNILDYDPGCEWFGGKVGQFRI